MHASRSCRRRLAPLHWAYLNALQLGQRGHCDSTGVLMWIRLRGKDPVDHQNLAHWLQWAW